MGKKKFHYKEDPPGRFRFMSKAMPFGIASGLIILGCLMLLFTKGLKYGIDFSGGTEVQVKFQQPVDASEVRSFVNGLNLGSSQVQSFGDENEYLVRMERTKGKTNKETNEMLAKTIKSLRDGFTTEFASQGAEIRRVDSVGPQVGSQLKRNGQLAIFYSLLLILIYIGLRFDYNFAPGAVTCLLHDTLFTLGILILLDKEINIQILAAMLTIIGYSLNDTIVVFDRIREELQVYKEKKLPWVIDRALNNTLNRTLTTSVTTLIAVVCLFVFAGGVIRDFAFAMGIGIVVGTYSSIFIASPMIIFFDRFKPISQQRT